MLIVERLRHIDAKGHPKEGLYAVSVGGQMHDYQVIRLPANVGGSRLWLRCICDRTVAQLYLYGKYLRCRHCLRLGYKSQLLDGYSRAYWREESLRKLLPCGARRPKGMHRTTYQAIKAQIRAAQQAQNHYFIASALPWLQRMERKHAK